jgi:hypothetical protein
MLILRTPDDYAQPNQLPRRMSIEPNSMSKLYAMEG